MPRNNPTTYEDDIIARRFQPPALARSTPFNHAISCGLKSPLIDFSGGVVGVSTSSEEELDNDLRQGIQNIM
jgi:hypothetical protein